jgi:hypothetical protein
MGVVCGFHRLDNAAEIQKIRFEQKPGSYRHLADRALSGPSTTGLP